ncbi:MAG: hypothetical protein K0R07_1056 [Sedimentibacter sp.]|jgi:hypothetical protein|nr:hypothetical protein [Sedimentibacter sp.]
MNRLLKLFCIVSVILVSVTTSGFASNWLVMEENSTSVYQVDAETVNFSGEDTDKQLEVWMKSLQKDGAGTYNVAHYLVKEKGLMFILKERTISSANGAILSSFQNTTDKWNATTPNTPIGSIASRLFAEYHKNPEAFTLQSLTNNLKGAGPFSTETKMKEATETAVDLKEVKKALDDELIKMEDANGVKRFYVRDRRGPALFSGITHYVTADFCLSIYGNAKRAATLQFTTEDTRAGTHKEKGPITIQVDGKDWVLSPSQSDSGGRNSVMYIYTYKLPDSLIQSIVGTKKPVTIKWMHFYNNSWENKERIIPDKTLRAIQLMYLGCTNEILST